MLKFLTRRRPVLLPAVPPTTTVYAIGDVHGCLDLLERLLVAISVDARTHDAIDPTIIFLGDLIDRGPDSSTVVDRLIRFRDERPSTRFLMGNHEELFLAALDGDPRALRTFCRAGGRATAISYGLTPESYERMDYDELREAMLSAVPNDHRRFIASFEDVIVVGDYAFVHAGVDPGKSLEHQSVADLRWIRSPFLDHRGVLEKIVVHGHTVSADIDWRPHRIGIDTGAYRTGLLTALALQGDRRWAIQVSSQDDESVSAVEAQGVVPHV